MNKDDIFLLLSGALTLSVTGGEGASEELAIAPKRSYISIWKFSTFLIYQKIKFWRRKKSHFFYPYPPQRGVIKKLRFWKLVGEPKLQNRVIPRQTTGKKLDVFKNASNFLYHLSNLNDDWGMLLLAILTIFGPFFTESWFLYYFHHLRLHFLCLLA